jgi:16S rRNA (uracil1498-N3)-methyltransferase
VLRARVGQEFDVAAAGSVRRGRIVSITESRVEFELGEHVSTAKLPEITLLLAVFKFDRMDWAIEKCTELGVARIVPVIARRTDPHLSAAAPKRFERWQRLVRQAAEQSRRPSPPQLAAPRKFKEAVQTTGSTRAVLAEQERQLALIDALDSQTLGHELVLAVGPEGGWTEDEVAAFSSAGWLTATLGPTILRAETAAIAAVAVAVAALS